MKTFTKITLLLLAIAFSGLASANHLSGKLLFSARFSGDQEVPPVSTDATGVGAFFINDAKDSLCVSITAIGLSGTIMGAHIHEGAIGTNGGVLVDFTSAISGNNIQSTITGDALTPELLQMMLDGELYFNIHTAAHPGGEIRGQILLEKDLAFRAMLDPEQENHEVTSDGLGLATFNLNKAGDKVTFYAVVDNLSSDITMAHLHMAPAGQDGGVVVDLGDFVMGNTIAGSFDPTEVDGLLEAMMMGNIYINVHTTNNPAGEVRGQLMAENRLSHDAWLDTEQEVPAPMGSEGVGLAFVGLNHSMDTLFYEALVTNLTGPITTAHFHEGEPGVAGGVLIGLDDDIMGNRISGFVVGAALTVENINKFLSGMIYLNVHTAMNPAGEIRGQVYKLAREGYTFRLSGDQEVPAVETMASGTGLVSIDQDQSNVHFMFAFNDLSGPATMAHFHMAPMGQNGGVIFDLGPFTMMNSSSDAAFGYWSNDDMMPFDAEAAAAFRNDMVYVNIHTAANPGGELRGQVLRSSICSDFVAGLFSAPVRRSLTLFPNPATDVAHIDLSSVPNGNYQLSLFDLTGKLVKQTFQRIDAAGIVDVNLSDVLPGIYFVQMRSEATTFSSKLVKQ